jgi:hypothetical protein
MGETINLIGLSIQDRVDKVSRILFIEGFMLIGS